MSSAPAFIRSGATFRTMGRWQSGRMHRFRKPANSTGFQGFESLSARHFSHRGSSRGEITIIAETRSCWGVAQLVEQRLLVPQVARSNRAAPASYSRLLCAKHKHAQPPHGYGPHYGRVAERSIAAGLNPAGPFGGRRFESDLVLHLRSGGLAQLAERLFHTQDVDGSRPSPLTMNA